MYGTIVVTGAQGFLGRHTARYFARRGYLVKGIGHGDWPVDEWKAWGLGEWRPADVTVDALQQYDCAPVAIVHCAGGGSVPISLISPWTDFQRTVSATVNVLEYVRVSSPSTCLIYPSSMSVYGIAETFPITEDNRLAPISPYGVHKMITEQLIAMYSRHFGVSASIVRFSSIYGIGLRKQLLWDACQKMFAGNPVLMGSGEEVRDWLHVEDAAALLFAATANADSTCPVVNGGTGIGVSVRDIVSQLAESLSPQSAKPLFSGPTRAGDPGCYIADTTRAKRWGWAPVEQWRPRVAEYAKWWRSHGITRAEATVVSTACGR